ncbi:pyrimidine reductase [Streptacidiphilus pinicola]|uniref:Pyrimidine reductase n=1 Tax=Streptacidiphilus pinicola TaxID=2219663 RepID=A0A2X0IFX4_9ACTN|nr:dihydrofolate reductase family protein [Streptacidiphilus pinicola]RAG82523.1 pyrimidine reductase [Streptacidiphilus pinicola]
MRRIKAGAFVTLDGVVQDPGGFGELDAGGWALPYFDEAAREHSTRQLLESETFLLGRETFEIVEKAWSANTGPYAEAMNAIPKLVVSRTLRGPLSWNATALTGEAARTVAELKRGEGGDIIMYASFRLLRTLLREDLVDQLTLGVHPVVLGEGKRLFDGAQPFGLRLVSATPSATGVVSLTYAR